jgi:hypothetical protein
MTSARAALSTANAAAGRFRPASANGAGSDPSGVKRYGIGAVAPVSKNHNIQSKDKDDDELL